MRSDAAWARHDSGSWTASWTHAQRRQRSPTGDASALSPRRSLGGHLNSATVATFFARVYVPPA